VRNNLRVVQNEVENHSSEEITMIENVIAILAGLVLLAGVFIKDGPGSRILMILVPFQGVIGLVAFVIGVLNFFTVIGIALIVAGLILGAEALAKIPSIGSELKHLGQSLSGMGGLVGAVLLILA
jgi:hypothetical protein